jgi:D-alanine-D-alanine ligase
MLEIMGIPYTGCRVMASAMGMNKDITKRLLRECGLPVLPSVTLRFPDDADHVYEGKYPAVVKPVCEGSSIGISIAHDRHALKEALILASRLDRDVMIEDYVEGRNFTVGVLDIGGRPNATPVREMIPKRGWYDYDAKYKDGLADFVCPARLPVAVTSAMRETALQVHRALDCRGLSRTDFIMDADGRFYVLEINTIPALTRHANFPAQVETMGLPYAQMVEAILHTAVSSKSLLTAVG